MKRFTLAVLVLGMAFVGALGLASRSAQAQDDMMTHTCDSTLIAVLYIAEYNYGFHSMEMDLATFEKGQFAPLFDAMMMAMEEMPTEETMMEEGNMMATEEAMMEDMVVLTPGNIEGEDEACTALRAELDAFLLAALKAEMMMDEGM